MDEFKKLTDKYKNSPQKQPDKVLSTDDLSLDERKALIKKLEKELGSLIPGTPSFKDKEKELIEAKSLMPNQRRVSKEKSKSQKIIFREDFKEGTDPSFEAELRRKLPEGVDVKDYMNYGFYEFKNCYFMSEKEGVDVVISNFTMKVKFLIKSKTEPKRLVEIKNMYGHKAMVDMSIETMVSLSKFCQAVESEGNFLFEGKESHLKKIKRKLFMEEKTSEEIRFLGFQKEASVYAFANGIFDGERFHEIDEYGIVEHKERNIYIPALSKINQYDDFSYENERKFVYKKSSIDFQEWAKLFYQTYQEKSIIAISFYVASIFRDVIFSQTRFFPILNLFGAPGTGKTTMAASLMFLFGDAQEPFMLGGAGTPKGFMRKFGQFYNSLIWLDEFKNSIDLKKLESLKNIYDGVGYEKALMTQDNKTKTTPIYSACLLSGEELPTGNEALFKRVIFIEFETATFNEVQKEAYGKLVTNQIQGISSLTTEILKHRALFVEQFAEKFNNSIDYLFKETKKEGENLDDRIIKNYAVLLATLDIIYPQIKLHFTLEQAKKYFVDRILYQSELISSSSKISKFWDIVQFLYETNQIVLDQDFKVVDNILYIRMSKIFPLYMDSHVRQFGERGLDKSSLTRYLERSKGFDSFITSTWFGKANSSAYKFNLDKLPIRLTYIPPEKHEDTEEVEKYEPPTTILPIQKNVFDEDSPKNAPF
ncbi:hypothetical protein AD998_07475 [bacterium 336/3]|nr:hypothetical protein AD998_07475 [bacterium 336/3]